MKVPRTARKKHDRAILHIMVRSISEVSLFKDYKDRDRYLELIKKYQEIYMFNVYAYCLMTTHGHLIIDCCGSDISKIMKSINQSYVLYYNKRYGRHGHLFQDRFKSKIVDDNRYLIALSAYIHSNPKDIKNYKNDVSKYPYSSLSIYLGTKVDKHHILNASFILQQFNNDIILARQTYKNLHRVNPSDIKSFNSKELIRSFELEDEKSEYRSERRYILREKSLKNLEKFIVDYTGRDMNLFLKYNHSNNELKSLFVVLARGLCDMSLKSICLVMGNMTLSNVCRLSQNGSNLICTDLKFKNIIRDFIKYQQLA